MRNIGLPLCITITISAALAACSGKHAMPSSPSAGHIIVNDKGFSTPKSYNGYQLIWADEFEQDAVDSTSWTFEIGTGGSGWGNNELQYYTARPENVRTQDGYLVITAKKEQYNGSAYTSTRMITKNKKVFTFGRIDIRAKLPEGQGIWPAFWMLGNNIDSVGWPASGEIDIMEMIGHLPATVHGTLHWGADHTRHTSKGGSTQLPSGKLGDEFHVYSLIWKKDSLEVLLDNKAYFAATRNDIQPGPYPFNDPHFLLFNMAVGGNWPGSPDSTTVFPQHLVVDYVRVFQ